jgi:CHASE2 domain-containing sensor protein
LAQPSWQTIRQRVQVLREVLLPTALVIGVVILMRGAGWLQIHEWMLFDSFSWHCPTRSGNQAAVVVVGIDEIDLEQAGGFPVSDRVLAKALKILAAQKPSAIGLDLFRNLPVEPGHAEFREALSEIPQLVGTEVALNFDPSLNVKPPPGLPLERVGFADVMVDDDGKLRRVILASPNWEGKVKYSLALRLAQIHLASRGVEFKHGRRSSEPLRFGTVQLPRFRSNAGSYIRADANGNQLILNFCASGEIPRVVMLRDVLQNRVPADWIRDHVVVIGMTASSVKDIFFTGALRETVLAQKTRLQMPTNQMMYGIEAQAQTVNQIVNAVLHQQPLIWVWAEAWEYLWIIFWGCLGVSISIMVQSPWKSVVGVAIAAIVLLAGAFSLLVGMGLWLPVVPPILSLCAAGLVTSFFDRDLRFELSQRRHAIEQTYESVHNGPLQLLAVILRSIGDQEMSLEQIELQLRLLNDDLRSIFERMQQEVSVQSEQLYLRGNLVLDLKAPVPDLLYQVYNHTRGEDLPGFATIRTFIPPDFEPLRLSCHSLEDKRGLSLFLHEALFNVGKHALHSTRLDVVCSVKAGYYCLQIIDNAPGKSDDSVGAGQGTRQARAIAAQLRGRFDRYRNSHQGTTCELVWKNRRPWWKKLKSRFMSKFNA